MSRKSRKSERTGLRIDSEMCANLVRQERLAERREPGQLALMAPRDEAERARDGLIGVAQTVGRHG